MNLNKKIQILKESSNKVSKFYKATEYNMFNNLIYLIESTEYFNELLIITNEYEEVKLKLINLLNVMLKNYTIIIKIIKETLPFIKMFLIYLVEKYYYNLSAAYFIFKVRNDKNTFNFFINFNKIKNLLTFKSNKDKPYVRLLFYYTVMFIALLYYFPITWFLLRVLTDKQNWMIYCFDLINLMLIS